MLLRHQLGLQRLGHHAVTTGTAAASLGVHVAADDAVDVDVGIDVTGIMTLMMIFLMMIIYVVDNDDDDTDDDEHDVTDVAAELLVAILM